MSEKNTKGSESIRGDILKKAFDQFDYLGIATKQYLIEDIEKQGIVFDGKHYYKLDEIEKRFKELFGRDVTPLLIEKLKRNLNNVMTVAVMLMPITILRLCHIAISTNAIIR